MNSKLLITLTLVLLVILSYNFMNRKSPETENINVTGTVKRFLNFESKFVESRHVDIWLPQSYSEDSYKRFPVIFMHDGQNLFDPEKSYIGVDWGIDETMTELSEKENLEAIIVGIWNSPKRYPEYMPQKPIEELNQSKKEEFMKKYGSEWIADSYLKFIVEELKPFVDSNFKTLSNRENTFVIGSSMGGLISLYAVCEFPEVFGGAACISTHWVVWDGLVLDYAKNHLPNPQTHKIYFDYGTETLDAKYEPYQLKADELMESAGFERDKNWITKKFEGHEHSERAWRKRVNIPLRFLLK
ncbi:MAG: alpha/beta hydrolase [Calditrichaeota bacterium]|nr:MAG: alpha/beta hydrolase [Calditrichota bacterium]